MPRFLAALPAVLILALAAGADEPRTITVHGKGTAHAKPDVLVVTFHASGKAEKATDAVDKLKEKVGTLRKDLEAILKEKGKQDAKVDDSGVSFMNISAGMGQTVMIWNGKPNGGEEGAGDMTASSEIHVTVPGVDGMKPEEISSLVSALLDKGASSESGQDAPPCGINVFTTRMGGGNFPVHFSFSDPEASLTKAWDEAVKKAHTRAETIASRLGLAVGSAVRVRDLSEPATSEKTTEAAAMAAIMGTGNRRAGVSSGEAELTVELEVEFELKKPDSK